MKPVEEGTQGSTHAAAPTTSEDNSGGTTDETTPTPAEHSTTTGPTDGPITTPDPPSASTTHSGISMVLGPPITLGLSWPVETTSEPSSRTPSSLSHFELNPTEADSNASPTVITARLANTSRSRVNRGNTVRFSNSDTISAIALQGEDESIDLDPDTLNREVQQYVRRRDSAIYDYYPGTESADYDYISERNDMYTTNFIEATAHLIKGSLGAVVLSMHEAYMIGGLWTSLAVTIATGVLIGYTMFMLISSAQKMYRRLRINKLTYPDLAEAAAATAPWRWVRRISKGFRYTVEITLLMHMCGTCCIYQIVIAHSMRQIIDAFQTGISEWLLDIRMLILISTPLLLPLCLIRSLKFLAPFALIADVFVAICVFATLYYCLLAFEVHIEERAAWKSVHGFIRVCGICLYGTSGICVALPVENNMKAPRYFPQVIQYATMIVILLTAMTGVFGYWAWGEECRSPITVHMPLNTFTTALQFLLVMMLSITFAVNFWVPFRIIWHYIVRQHFKHLACWERVYRFLLAILVMGASMAAPRMIPVMVFIGQFFLGFVALIFPAFIEFFVDWEEHYASRARVRYYHNSKNFGLVVLGLMLSGSTFYSVREN